MEVERGDGDEKNAAAEMKCCGGWTAMAMVLARLREPKWREE